MMAHRLHARRLHGHQVQTLPLQVHLQTLRLQVHHLQTLRLQVHHMQAHLPMKESTMVRLLEEGRMEGLAVGTEELHLFGLLTVAKEKRATGMPYFTFTRSTLKLTRKRG